MPGAFKLDSLLPFKPVLLQHKTIISPPPLLSFPLKMDVARHPSPSREAPYWMSVIGGSFPCEIQRSCEGKGEGDLLIHSCQIYYLG